ncbi:tetratricopeptide repeat protein [Actinomadura oligospora]|uniref:tetratricopeptide repeat protein n=1 Tax=Actinomadura oligospora TaxID=111804 RepID=UPI000479AD1E|nr:tetratricopeptide repeat protein [Actinomadura oligospora]
MVDGSPERDSGNRPEAHRAAFEAFAEQMRKGDHRTALAAARAVHDQVLAAGDPDLRGVALNCVGLAQFELGEFADAAESHQQAKGLGQRSDVRAFASMRANLAKIAAGESVAYPEVWEADSAPGQLAALARSEHPYLAAAAGVELGRLLRGERHFLAAIRAYQAVVDSGHPWFRTRAAVPLAELLREAGDHTAAARVLEHADPESDAPDMVDLALAALDDPDAPSFWLAPVRPGLAHYRAGDLDAARAELRSVAAGDWQHAAHQAATVLAGIELRHGDPATAHRILNDLAESADFTYGPRAAVALVVLNAAEDTEAAATAVAPASALARYLTRDQGAAAELEALAHSEHPLAGAFAALLADLLDDGRPGASDRRATAARSGDRLASGYTAYLNAIDLTTWDDTERVSEALTQAYESASAVLPWAALRLGEVGLTDFIGIGDSQFCFHAVLETGHRALMPRAAAGLFDSSPADSWVAEERYKLAGELLATDLPPEAVPPLAWLTAENLISYEDDLDAGQQALERIPESDPRFGAPAQAARLLLDDDAEGMRSVFERLTRWDEQSLELASECCMSVLWKLPDESSVTRQALHVLADLGDKTAPLSSKVLERLARVCRIQNALDGELAAKEASYLRRQDGHPGGGVLEVARRHHLAGDLDQAIELYRRVNTPEFPQARRKAAVALGVLFRHQGRHEEADGLPPLDVPPQYCFTLGTDLESAGRTGEAVLAWKLIARTSDVTWAVRANFHLGQAHAKLGETDDAIAAYKRAGSTEDSFFRGMAWHELGCLYQDQGDLELAKEFQQRGADVGARLGKDDGETVIGACKLRLAQLATLAGDTEEARRLALDMVETGDRGTGAMGAMLLGGVAKERRDVPEARRWYQWVIDSGDRFQRELALAHLGELYHRVGDRDQAREFYQLTLDSTRSTPELVAEAAYRMGEMAEQNGDADQAARYLEQARDTGDTTFGPQAELLLSRLTGGR